MKAQYSMSALGLGRVKTALKGVGFGHSDASVAGEQSLARQHQRRVLGKPTWRCLIRLSLSSAWLAPQSWEPHSAHIHGTDVPVEEPSTWGNRGSELPQANH